MIRLELCRKFRYEENSLGFWDTNRSSNLNLTIRSSDSQMKKNERKENLRNNELCYLGWPLGKTKKEQKKDKCLYLVKELKKPRNINLTMMPVVIGALSTVTEELEQGLEDLEIRGRVGTIQTTALLNRPEYWEEWWRFEETCCHSDSSENPSANAGVKISGKSKITPQAGQQEEGDKKEILWLRLDIGTKIRLITTRVEWRLNFIAGENWRTLVVMMCSVVFRSWKYALFNSLTSAACCGFRGKSLVWGATCSDRFLVEISSR